MDTALKKMFSPRQSGNLCMAALQNAGLCNRDVRKAVGTFGNHVLPRGIEQRYKSASELPHLRESVRLATLVDYVKNGVFLHMN